MQNLRDILFNNIMVPPIFQYVTEIPWADRTIDMFKPAQNGQGPIPLTVLYRNSKFVLLSANSSKVMVTNVARGTTAVLSRHVQKVAIGWQIIEVQQWNFYVEFELRYKIVSNFVPRFE